MAGLALTQSAAQSQLEKYVPIIEAGLKGGYSITALDHQLEQEEKILVENAKRVYSLFNSDNYSLNTIDDIIAFENILNRKIEEAKATADSIPTVGNLSGPELDKIFIHSFDSSQTFERDIQEQWSQYLQQLNARAQQLAMQKATEITPALVSLICGDLFSGAFKAPVTGGSIGKTGMIHVKTGGGSKFSQGGQKNVGRISNVFNECGRKIQDGFREYLKTNPFRFNNKKIVIKDVKTTQNSTYNGVSVELELNGETINTSIESLFKMNEKNRENFFAGMPESEKIMIVKRLNEEYKKVILERCGDDSNGYLSRAIDKVLNFSDLNRLQKAFFGATNKNMIGILGEIQTIYFLFYLGGDKLINSIDWIGGLGSQKPHADILLRSAVEGVSSNFGIQVKNTTKDLNITDFSTDFQSLGFSSKSGTYNKNTGIYTILHTDQALKEMGRLGMPPYLMEAVETLIGMEGFNIEYQRVRERQASATGKKGRNTKKVTSGDSKKVWLARPESNAAFKGTRQQIVAAAALCQQFMSFFATQMMYMQQLNVSGGQTNTLYFVGGSLVMSAATMIKGLIDHWKGIKAEAGKDSFDSPFKASLGLDSSHGFTIVDMINKGGEESLKGISLGLNTSYTFVKH